MFDLRFEMHFKKFSSIHKACNSEMLPRSHVLKSIKSTLYFTDPENTVDLNKLAQKIRQKLPKYARPLFIRLIQELKLTGTYKLIKGDLQKEGYDIQLITDPVYFMGPGEVTYKKLDGDLFRQIKAGGGEQIAAKL